MLLEGERGGVGMTFLSGTVVGVRWEPMADDSGHDRSRVSALVSDFWLGEWCSAWDPRIST